jgi:hypothetical protein
MAGRLMAEESAAAEQREHRGDSHKPHERWPLHAPSSMIRKETLIIDN